MRYELYIIIYNYMYIIYIYSYISHIIIYGKYTLFIAIPCSSQVCIRVFGIGQYTMCIPPTNTIHISELFHLLSRMVTSRWHTASNSF